MSESMTFSVISMILNILGDWSVGCPTAVTSWSNVMPMALVAVLGYLCPVIATECNFVCFFDIVQLPE